MQPYFFPYVGYFSLIKHTDQFILFDPVQFIRHGWIERNRVLKQGVGWLYIKVPLQKHERGTPIKDLRIDNNQDWQKTILAQLQTYKKIAPHYVDVLGVVNRALEGNTDSIVQLNKKCLEEVCAYLKIEKSLDIFSEMNLQLAPVKAPDEWALNTCLSLGSVDEYWNPPGGQDFFDPSKYDSAGIRLRFQKIHIGSYDQKREPFEPGLSIIDVLMFNSVDKVNEMLDDFELE
ncbi:WbqC family protein [Candidatus Saccharibacteria bacterium]|nr:WbqC family protein [Candidatus Saccharibacteria bacterium]